MQIGGVSFKLALIPPENVPLVHLLRHVIVVGKQLLGVLRKAVAAVTEGRIVVMRADAQVQAHSVYDGLGVQTLHLSICVQLVEIAHAQREVGVGKEFNCLSTRSLSAMLPLTKT